MRMATPRTRTRGSPPTTSPPTSVEHMEGLNWSQLAAEIEREDAILATRKRAHEPDHNDNNCEIMKLRKEDMSVYGTHPADDFFLVQCEICQQVVKPQALERHIEQRHGHVNMLNSIETPPPSTKSDASSSSTSSLMNHSNNNSSNSNSKDNLINNHIGTSNLAAVATSSPVPVVPLGASLTITASTATMGTNSMGSSAASSYSLKTIPITVIGHPTARSNNNRKTISEQPPKSRTSPELPGTTLPIVDIDLDNEPAFFVEESKQLPVVGSVEQLKAELMLSTPVLATLAKPSSIDLPIEPVIEKHIQPSLETVGHDLGIPVEVATSASSLTATASSSISNNAGKQTAIKIIEPHVMKVNLTDEAKSSEGTSSSDPVKIKKETKKAPRKAGPVREKLLPCKDREYDPDKHCGVIVAETGKPCTRSLTCKTHSLTLRRQVPNRSRTFDVLLSEHRAHKEALLREAGKEVKLTKKQLKQRELEAKKAGLNNSAAVAGSSSLTMLLSDSNSQSSVASAALSSVSPASSAVQTPVKLETNSNSNSQSLVSPSAQQSLLIQHNLSQQRLQSKPKEQKFNISLASLLAKPVTDESNRISYQNVTLNSMLKTEPLTTMPTNNIIATSSNPVNSSPQQQQSLLLQQQLTTTRVPAKTIKNPKLNNNARLTSLLSKPTQDDANRACTSKAASLKPRPVSTNPAASIKTQPTTIHNGLTYISSHPQPLSINTYNSRSIRIPLGTSGTVSSRMFNTRTLDLLYSQMIKLFQEQTVAQTVAQNVAQTVAQPAQAVSEQPSS